MKIHQLGTDWRWMLVFYHRRPLELDTDGIWCVLPASFPENFQVHLRKMWGVEKNCKNAFKCNLKELTTKKAYSASGPRSVTMHLPSSSPHLSCHSWSMACGVCPALSCHKIFLSVDFPPKLLSLFFLHWYFSVWWVPVSLPLFVGSLGWVVLLWQPWGHYSN